MNADILINLVILIKKNKGYTIKVIA